MLTSYWRFSHLLLALFSSVFLLIATITGIILSTEPVADYVNAPSYKSITDTTKIAQLIPKLEENYLEVFSVFVNKEKAVKVSVIGLDSDTDGEFYIHPTSGEKIAEIQPQHIIYSWTTILHRSLFMNNSGRIIMGITVFLVFLMAISGLALVLKQTQGFRKLFHKINKHNKSQYNHTVLGRLFFPLIVVMSLSGAIMFLGTQLKFDKNITKEYAQKNTETIEVTDFPIFTQTTLSEIKTLHFPFSDDEEDYFELELENNNLKINQYTGEIIEENPATSYQSILGLSETLHTGRGQYIWAIVLGFVALNILYFMYSGTKIAWRRWSSKTRNKIHPDKAEFIILVGSENGTTRKFASVLHTALTKANHTSFIANLNDYQSFKNAKHLVIMTSTYGNGTAPFNARNFLKKTDEIQQNNSLKTHIIGFGSMSYPNFCKYAIDVFEKLNSNTNFELNGLPDLIHGQSYVSFVSSIEKWAKQHEISVSIPSEDTRRKLPLIPFKVVQKHEVDDGFAISFSLELEPQIKTKFQSGDLLGIVPPNDTVTRYYSVGKKENGNILLSIKKHDFGACSTYLFNQNINAKITASIKQNKDFHFPKKGAVLVIANGTGIAPFLGLNQSHHKQKKTFFLGGRNDLSFKLYDNFIQKHHNKPSNCDLFFAFSKKENEAKYVQDVVSSNSSFIVGLLKNKGTIMICGSVKMRNGVLEELKIILEKEKKGFLEDCIKSRKILMDCY